MKILHVVHTHPSLGSTGGTELYVQAIAAARGDPVFTRDHGAELRKQGRLWIAGVPPARDFRESWSAPSVAAALARVVDDEKPDGLHVHHLAHLDLSPPTSPYLLTLHDYHLACARGQLVNRESELCEGPSPERCASCVVSQLRAPRSLLGLGQLVHAMGMTELARKALSASPPTARMIDEVASRNAGGRSVLDGARRILSPSAALARRFEGMGLARDIHVQDLPLLTPITSRPRQPGPVRFLFVGSLIPTKGPMLLLRAFARIGEGELQIWGPRVPYFGESRYADTVVRMAERTPRTRYCGVFESEQRQEVYAGGDVLVVPSTWPENSPLVVREAVAAGLRVIATDHGGVGEIDPGARLVPAGDVGALTTAMAEHLDEPSRRGARDFPMDRHLHQLARHYEACFG